MGAPTRECQLSRLARDRAARRRAPSRLLRRRRGVDRHRVGRHDRLLERARVVLLSVARSSGALAAHVLIVTRESVGDGCGSDGTDGSTVAKLNAAVRSPVTERRHADRFGTSAPKRVSSRRSTDVWSNVVEQTKPPRLNGETTSIGTRKPSPIGPATPDGVGGERADGEVLARGRRPARPAAARGRRSRRSRRR